MDMILIDNTCKYTFLEISSMHSHANIHELKYVNFKIY